MFKRKRYDVSAGFMVRRTRRSKRRSFAMALGTALSIATAAVAYYAATATIEGTFTTKAKKDEKTVTYAMTASISGEPEPGKFATIEGLETNNSGSRAVSISKGKLENTITTSNTECKPEWFTISDEGPPPIGAAPVLNALLKGEKTFSVPVGKSNILTDAGGVTTEVLHLNFVNNESVDQSACSEAEIHDKIVLDAKQ